MTRYMTEILSEISKDPTTIPKWKDNAALKMVLGYAFLPENKFVLPEGEPPYKPDDAPIGMSPTNFLQEVRRLYIFTKAKDLIPLRREQLFIQLLETLHPSEARLLLAIKDQTLPELYKGLDVKLLVANGLLPERILALPTLLANAPQATDTVPVKRKPGRPKKVKI